MVKPESLTARPSKMQMLTLRATGIEVLCLSSIKGPNLSNRLWNSSLNVKSQSRLRPTGGRGIRFTINKFAASFLAASWLRFWCSLAVPLESVSVAKHSLRPWWRETQSQEYRKSILCNDCFQIWQEATKKYGDKIFSGSALQLLRLSL